MMRMLVLRMMMVMMTMLMMVVKQEDDTLDWAAYLVCKYLTIRTPIKLLATLGILTFYL